MAYNTYNVIVGAADIFIATAVNTASNQETPLPTLAPATRAVGPAPDRYLGDDTGTDWRHVGLTTGGVEVAYAPDFGEVEVDQLLDSAKMFKQRQSVTVSTTFAEATLENLLFAWGQPVDTLTDGAAGADDILVMHSGELGDAPVERSLAFVGPAPGSARERVYHLKRVLSVDSSSHSLSRADATTIPVSLRCLPDGSGEYGRIVDRSTSA